jgi:hypothetical protein
LFDSNNRPTDLERAAMLPSRWVLFLRTFWLYQFLRFLIINVRMTAMILKSRHRTKRIPHDTPAFDEGPTAGRWSLPRGSLGTQPDRKAADH